jgi:hypothetical protein
MKVSHEALRHNIETGTPTDQIVDDVTKHELSIYIKDAEEASLIAHGALSEGYDNNDPRVIQFTDDPDQPNKYLSFADRDGQPLFGPWDPDRPASDIGIRSASPDFDGIVNPTTVIHADMPAIEEFRQKGAPQEVIDAIATVAKLNEFVIDTIARPYLAAVATVYDIDPAEYQANFFRNERQRREQILTRVIMYHTTSAPGQRPIGSDGTPLLIKEHVDKSSWTIDLHQTSPGLQYRVGKQWQDASTDIAAFRGTADSYLPTRLPATLHRAINKEHAPDSRLSAVGIGRIAVPMFISPIHEDARVVSSHSAETHPTSYSLS